MPGGGGSRNCNPVRTSSRRAASKAVSPVDPARLARVTRPVESDHIRARTLSSAVRVLRLLRIASPTFDWTWPAYQPKRVLLDRLLPRPLPPPLPRLKELEDPSPLML